MTESDYNYQISQNYAAIGNYQAQIRDLEEKIEKLNKVKTSLGNVSASLSDTASRAWNRVNGMTTLSGKVTSFLNISFFSDILNAIKGTEYAQAEEGVNTSAQIVADRIGEFQEEINRLNGQIRSCNSAISGLENEKKAYLAAEAQRAAQEAAADSQA